MTSRRPPTRGAMAVVATLLVTGSLLIGAPRARAQEPDPDPDAALELAERYAPIVMLKAQGEECDRSAEGFEPASVDMLLGNPEVVLRQAGNYDPVVIVGPEAS